MECVFNFAILYSYTSERLGELIATLMPPEAYGTDKISQTFTRVHQI